MLLQCLKVRWTKKCIWLAGIVLILFTVLISVAGATIPPVIEKNLTVVAEQDEDILTSLVSTDGLVLKVRLGENNKEYAFLLDTGAEMSVIDNQLVKELALPQLLEIESCDSNRNIKKVQIYNTKSFLVGKMAINNLPVLGLDMTFLRTTYDVPIDGIIGYNFLKHFVVTLDYQHNQVVLSRKSKMLPEKRVLVAKVNENDYAVTVPATIDGVAIDPFIDTGAMCESITVPDELIEKCKIKRYSIGGIIEGAFGYANRNTLAKAQVTIGNYNFKDALVISSATPVLGHKFLSQFKVIIDYPGQKAWLIPNGRVALPEDEYGTGLGFNRNEQGYLFVNGIWEGSSADLAQFHVGDKIIAINGIKTTDRTEASWRHFMHDNTVQKLEMLVKNQKGVHKFVLEKTNLFSSYGKKYL